MSGVRHVVNIDRLRKSHEEQCPLGTSLPVLCSIWAQGCAHMTAEMVIPLIALVAGMLCLMAVVADHGR